MKNKMKKAKRYFAGSIVCAVSAVLFVIMRIANGNQIKSVKNDIAQIIQYGSETMSRSEYLEMAGKLNTTCVVLAVVCALAAAAFYMAHKKISNSLESGEK